MLRLSDFPVVDLIKAEIVSDGGDGYILRQTYETSKSADDVSFIKGRLNDELTKAQGLDQTDQVIIDAIAGINTDLGNIVG